MEAKMIKVDLERDGVSITPSVHVHTPSLHPTGPATAKITLHPTAPTTAVKHVHAVGACVLRACSTSGLHTSAHTPPVISKQTRRLNGLLSNYSNTQHAAEFLKCIGPRRRVSDGDQQTRRLNGLLSN